MKVLKLVTVELSILDFIALKNWTSPSLLITVVINTYTFLTIAEDDLCES